MGNNLSSMMINSLENKPQTNQFPLDLQLVQQQQLNHGTFCRSYLT